MKQRVCAKCESSSIVNDRELIPGLTGGWHEFERCMKCSCRTFKEIEVKEKAPRIESLDALTSPMSILPKTELPIQKVRERTSMVHVKDCKKEGCKKAGVAHGYCYSHFHDVYGITYIVYKQNHLFRKEDPFSVAKRVLGLKTASVPEPAECVKKGEEIPHTPSESQYKNISTEDIKYVHIPMPTYMFNILIEAAKEDFRTPELQILYYIYKGLNGKMEQMKQSTTKVLETLSEAINEASKITSSET
jgi:hypothetical protein